MNEATQQAIAEAIERMRETVERMRETAAGLSPAGRRRKFRAVGASPGRPQTR